METVVGARQLNWNSFAKMKKGWRWNVRTLDDGDDHDDEEEEEKNENKIIDDLDILDRTCKVWILSIP